jgi:hypothetical protein
MSLFRCPECHNIYSDEEWNDATIEVYGEDITEMDDSKDFCTFYTFICPNCREDVDGEDIDEID